MSSQHIIFLAVLFSACLSQQYMDSENYRVYWGTYRTTFTAANSFCATQHGTYLAQILSAEQDTEAFNLIVSANQPGWYWIGYSDYYAPGSSEGDWRQMSDGNPGYTNWDVANGQPDNGPVNQHCAVMANAYGGLWRDGNCGSTYAFLCSLYKQETSDNYIYTQGPQKNWDDANTYCDENFGTNLAEILSQDDQTEVQNLVDSGRAAWIGLSDDTTPSQWYWNTIGNYGGYTNWICGEPNNSGGNENCALLVNNAWGGGGWNDDECTEVTDFVCDRY